MSIHREKQPYRSKVIVLGSFMAYFLITFILIALSARHCTEDFSTGLFWSRIGEHLRRFVAMPL
jgi:hypothetical protein